jgi:hypothetical protein
MKKFWNKRNGLRRYMKNNENIQFDETKPEYYLRRYKES